MMSFFKEKQKPNYKKRTNLYYSGKVFLQSIFYIYCSQIPISIQDCF